MPETKRHIQWKTATPLVFYAAYFLYVWWRIQPGLFYDASPYFPVFQTGLSFLRETLSRPGGLSDYLAGALSLTCYWGWAGALGITAMAWLGTTLAGSLLRVFGLPPMRWVRVLPPLAILALYGSYGYALQSLCALLIAVACALAFARLAPRHWGARVALFTLLGGVVSLAAAGAVHVYVVVATLYEIRASGLRARTCVLPVLAEAMPCVTGVVWLNLEAAQAYGRLSPLDEAVDPTAKAALTALFLLYPLVAGGALLWPAIARWAAGHAGAVQVRPALRALLMLAVAAAAVLLPVNTSRRSVRRIAAYTRHRQWARALAEARRLQEGSFTFDAVHNTLQALFYTGHLLDSLFSFPQAPESISVCLPEGTGVPDELARLRETMFLAIGDQTLQMGLVNEAAHEAHESVVVMGDHPTVLLRLARIYMVKGQPEAARVYLRELERHPLHRREARELLARLEADPQMRRDPEVQRIRSRMLPRDPRYLLSAFGTACLALLEVNPRNRMAFEYLMAGLLLERNLDAIISYLPRIGVFHLPRLPRHLQEAVVLYEAKTKQEVDLGEHAIDPEVRAAFEDFSARVVPLQQAGDIEGAKRATAAKYGNSFFYYYVFGESGAQRQ